MIDFINFVLNKNGANQPSQLQLSVSKMMAKKGRYSVKDLCTIINKKWEQFGAFVSLEKNKMISINY